MRINDLVHHDPDTTAAVERPVVVGFFTPDYEQLAQSLAGSLQSHGESYHFYAKNAADWAAAILLKPQVLLTAWANYPGRCIVQLDVDCAVHAPLTELAELPGDVALAWRAKRWRERVGYLVSARVLVWQPTKNARLLAESWRELCSRAQAKNDELLLTQAIASRGGVSIATLPESYSARHERPTPGGREVITHTSQRKHQLQVRGVGIVQRIVRCLGQVNS